MNRGIGYRSVLMTRKAAWQGLARLLVIQVLAFSSVEAGAEEPGFQFHICDSSGKLEAGPLEKDAIPRQLAEGRWLLQTDIEDSVEHSYLQVRASISASIWNKAVFTDPLLDKVQEENRMGYVVKGLPGKYGTCFLIELDEDGRPVPTGIFRVFLATDPSALFTDVPRRDYVLAAYRLLDDFLGARKLSTAVLPEGDAFGTVMWEDLKPVKLNAKDLSAVIERRIRQQATPATP